MASGLGGGWGAGAPSLLSDVTPVQVCSVRGAGADSFRALKAAVSRDVGRFGNLIWEGLSVSLVITYALPESLKIISIM